MLRRTGLALLLVALASMAFLALYAHPVLSQATHLEITPDGGSAIAGTAFSITVTAYDASENVDTIYTGTVHFTSSDPAVTLPGDYTFQLSDNGTCTFTDAVTFRTSGNQTVTVTDNAALTDTATWSVNADVVNRIAVSPDTSAITAGSTQAYTVEAFDQFNNSLGDVTSTTTFSIEDGAGGSWAANVYTSQNAGTWTVTGTYNTTFSDTATLNVSAGAVNHIVISPATAGITAGSTQAYTAEAFDQFNNSLGNVTSTTVFSIGTGAGGSWAANVYTSQNAGNWTVTGTYNITFSDTAALNVNAGAINHIVISPDNTTIIATTIQTYTAEAFDASNNSLGDVTSTTVFSIEASAGGSWAASVYTSQNAGNWTVTGTYNTTFLDTATLTVNAGTVDHIVISPDNATITATASQTYTAEAFDVGNNSLGDVTAQTTFTIDLAAGGSWSANIYTSQTSGNWTVTGTYSALPASPDTTSLTVAAGPPHHIVISPDNVTITAGSTQAYTAEVFDIGDNSLGDVTAQTAFSVDSAAGGSWSANVYTSQTSGNWTVTGIYSGFIDTTALTVTASAPQYIVISPDNVTISAGTSQTYTAEAFDAGNNSLGDVTAQTTFTIDLAAGGSWSANIYTSQTSGTWTVTGTYSALPASPDTTSLTITAGTPHYIVISPDNVTISAGNSQTYTAEVFDIGNNTLGDVTAQTTFTIDLAAGGSWAANVYTSQTSGNWTITGTYSALPASPDTTPLTVTAGAPHHIVISPDNVTIPAGTSQTYTAQAFDIANNSLGDVTAQTTFTIDLAAGGSWAANIYTSQTSGTWTVTGAYSALPASPDTTPLTVSAGVVDHYEVISDNYTQRVTIPFTVTVTAYDSFGNLVPSDNVSVVMSSSPSGLLFDGNANGTYGETGDDTGTLVAGVLNIEARARSAVSALTITATDDDAKSGDSETYTIEDFRCFIATAAYGTPMIDQIQVLRDFRDGYLMTNPAGRWFVSTYYRLSPPLARFIARHDSLRALVRVGLTPTIWVATFVMKGTLIQKVIILLITMTAFIEAILWIRKRRQSQTP